MRRLLSPPVVVAVLAAALSPVLAAAATAHEQFQVLLAPFECGSEWAGTTRAGHGLNDWNLDLNRTSRTFADPQHDLGQPILAQADGVVSWVGWHERAGTYLDVDYGDVTVRYVHLVDDSIPGGVDEVGDAVALGELLGLLGDTGNATHAHLHLEYFDSRDHVDAAGWQIPDENQIQITMNGEPIDPGEAFISTNCGSGPPPTTTTTVPPPYPFGDVDPDSYAHADIALLAELAITTGTGPDTYSPADPVTREQMAAFLARLWRLTHPEWPEPAGPPPFGDVDPDSYAHADIALLAELAITTGTGPDTYSPADPVTREQMAAFLARLLRSAGLA